jgi:hypothetical protein
MLSPVDAHEVAECVALGAYNVGERISQSGDSIDEFLAACEELEPFVEAVRWLTGRDGGELSQEAIDVIRQARGFWRAALEDNIADGTDAESIARGRRQQAEFDRVLDTVGWA